MAKFDKENSAYFITRLTDDMEKIDDLPLNYFFSVLLEAIGLVGILAYKQLSVLPCNYLPF